MARSELFWRGERTAPRPKVGRGLAGPRGRRHRPRDEARGASRAFASRSETNMVKRGLVLQHVPFEGPAAIGEVCREVGLEVEVRRLDLGDAVPEAVSPEELLVVMGGPMGIGDIGSPEFPFLEREVELVRRCLTDEAPILGVCLGAQLIAHVASAPVQPMKAPDGARVFELGWAPVKLHKVGPGDPILGGLEGELSVFHWHGDHFALPSGARLLASTEVCPAQGFLLGARAVGLQFHIEVGLSEIETVMEADRSFLVRARGERGLEAIREETKLHEAPSLGGRQRLLRNIVEFLARG